MNEKYLSAVENVAMRNIARLRKEEIPKPKFVNIKNEGLGPTGMEKEEIFYWLLSRLDWTAKNCWPAQEYHSITVKEDFEVLGTALRSKILRHGSVSKYHIKFISVALLVCVMMDIADIFNEIGKRDGYYFWATCYIVDYKVVLNVIMKTEI